MGVQSVLQKGGLNRLAYVVLCARVSRMEVKVDEGMQGGNGAHWERIQWWAAYPRKIRGFKVIQGYSRLNFFRPFQAGRGRVQQKFTGIGKIRLPVVWPVAFPQPYATVTPMVMVWMMKGRVDDASQSSRHRGACFPRRSLTGSDPVRPMKFLPFVPNRREIQRFPKFT